MDGEKKDCPVVEANIIRLRYGEEDDEELVVSPTHDTIQIFPEPKYNYLRYFNPSEGVLVAVWLGHEVLADLVDGGIPSCMRKDITEQEVELYEHHLGKIAIVGVSNCIEVEEAMDEVNAENLTDAEIYFFLDEWGAN